MKTCGRCRYSKIPDDKNLCPACGHWEWATPALTATFSEITETIRYEDVKESELKRYPIGLMDECLGGGLVQTDVVLLGGGPGGGKSTLMLQTAEALCKIGKCLYIGAEEDIRTIKLRGVRLGIKPRGNLYFLPAISGVANIGSTLAREKPRSMIIDSIDALSGKDLNVEVEMLNVIKKYCIELNAPALVISQVNGSGDMAGLTAKKHAVDVLMTLFATEDRSPNGEAVRVMNVEKNRSGQAFIERDLWMSEAGLEPAPEFEEDPDDSDD